jgi:hypothetical protein
VVLVRDRRADRRGPPADPVGHRTRQLTARTTDLARWELLRRGASRAGSVGLTSLRAMSEVTNSVVPDPRASRWGSDWSPTGVDGLDR